MILPKSPITFANSHISGSIVFNEKTFKFRVTGTVTDIKPKYIRWNAAAPPDARLSYAGSALPWPNETIAFDSNINKGKVKIDSTGSFTFEFDYPNAYYINGGSKLIDPEVKIYGTKLVPAIVKLNTTLGSDRILSSGPGMPNRSMGSSWGTTGGKN